MAEELERRSIQSKGGKAKAAKGEGDVEEHPYIRAVVAFTRSWFEAAGLHSLLSVSSGAPHIMLPVTEYSLADSAFVEITMYPRSMAPNCLKLHIPKREVLAIVEIDGPQRMEKLGFLGNVDTV